MAIKEPPELVEIKGGWAAVGNGWAVFGSTRDDALREFESAELRHEEIRERATQDQPVTQPDNN